MAATIWGTTSSLSTISSYIFNVKDTDYGAVGDGSTNDTAAVQSTIDAANAAGGGVVFFPKGTYFCDALIMAANVSLVGVKRLSILKFATSSGVNAFVTANAVANVEFEELTFDLNEATGTVGTGPVAIYHLGAGANNIVIRNCRFQGGLVRPYTDFRSTSAVRGVIVDGCEFIGKATATTQTPPATQRSSGIRFLAGTGCGDWQLTNNTFRLCGNSIQIRKTGGTWGFDEFDTVVIANNKIYNVPDDPNVSSSPMEISSITGLSVTGNIIHSGGRGLSALAVKSATYSGNALYDQTRYFLEMSVCDGVTIVGNTAVNCKTFVNDNSNPIGSKNVIISNNTISGGNVGESGYDANDLLNCIQTQPSTSGYENWRIEGNLFVGLKYISYVCRMDGTDTKNFVFNHNTIIQTEESQWPPVVFADTVANAEIRFNNIVRTANISDLTLATSSISAFIPFTVGAGNDGLLIEGNTINFTGTDTRTSPNNTGVYGIGPNSAASTYTNLIIRHNKIMGNTVKPMNIPVTSNDCIVEDNDTRNATGSNTINAAIVNRRSFRTVEGTTAPTVGTWAVGDRCYNSAPTAGQPKSWVCTVAGTPGTWSSEGNL